ncbi:MAG: exodeoxyribonuclease VII large subunit [Pseudomonadota bacterium]
MTYTESTISENRTILSVTELNQQLKQTITTDFALVWIEGEISNLARPASGHIYFSLKDQNAQIRCAMFRSNNHRVSFEISNGTHVIARAKASLYEPRGDLQLIVDDLEEAGTGALQRQFELLKKKLHSEGLFDENRKKTLPLFPKEIAVVTSASSAAIKDFLEIAQRRFPACKKTLYHVPVQGDPAPAAIVAALQTVNLHGRADIIVLIRGGGSIEDLWAFNDEAVARSISDSQIPVITGIGHEIDYTIADFVADLRAPTPSAVAELVCPESFALAERLRAYQALLSKLFKDKLNTNNQNLDWLSQRLQRTHPVSIVLAQIKSVRQHQLRIQRAMESKLNETANKLDSHAHRLRNQSPQQQLTLFTTQLNQLFSRLAGYSLQKVKNNQHRLQICITTMQAVNPLNTLERGYSVTMAMEKKNEVLSHHNQIKPGDQMVTYLAKGQIVSRVESTRSQNLIKSSSHPKLDID